MAHCCFLNTFNQKRRFTVGLRGITMIQCPRCSSTDVKKNGFTDNQKQNHKCLHCGRQFIQNPQRQPVSEQRKAIFNRLLLERISLRGIARVLCVSMSYVMDYIAQQYTDLPDDLGADIPGLSRPDGKGKVLIQVYKNEADEQWSFVQNKKHQAWLWVALDVDTRQVIAMHVGSREDVEAKRLWLKIPKRYRLQATFYTDGWEAYQKVIPAGLHCVSKYEGKANHIERFFCTLRQRVSRLVRKTLSFSKKWENHVGAIKYFICYYNKEQAALLV